MKKIINNFLKSLTGYRLIKDTYYHRLTNNKQKENLALGIISNYIKNSEDQKKLLNFLPLSESNSQSDFFVLSVLQQKKNGIFVEFGGMDGKLYSNTYMLEKQFDWDGLIIEPSRQFHKSLIKNRKCELSFSCLSDKDDETVIFNELPHGLSTINKFSSSDAKSEKRKNGNLYELKTIKLETLLNKINFNKKIDFMSIDTEGSEFEILKNFNFNKYSIKIICVEHNFNHLKRKALFNLLSNNKFTRVMENFSRNDDWYINEKLISQELTKQQNSNTNG